jgi:peroxiredoxin
MKKFLLFLSFFVFGVSSAQTTADNWQKADCDGNNYNLYDMCDSGNIVIMEFVMMNCTPCVTAADQLRQVVEEFGQSHPGRVKIFSISFNNSTTCSALKTWKMNAGAVWPVIANGKEILAQYGEMGMPTIAVVGHDKKVLYTSIGFSSAKVDELKTAISNGLAQSSVVAEKVIEGGFVVSPNPSSYSISIHTSAMMRAVSYRIINMKGNTVLEGRYNDSRDATLQVRSGSSDPIIISTLPSGTYTILLTLSDGTVRSTQFTVTR